MAQSWMLTALELRAAGPESNTASRKLIKAKDLPIYVEAPRPSKPTPVQDLYLQDYVSVVRKEACKLVKAAKGPYDTAVSKIDVAKAHTESLIKDVQADPTVAVRPGIVALAVLGGSLSAFRKSMFTKMFYATAAGLIGASACYPKEALRVSTDGYHYAKDTIQKQWERYNAAPAPPVENEVKEAAASVVSESRAVVSSVVEPQQQAVKASKPLEDFGMSKEEDKDMYTTRSK